MSYSNVTSYAFDMLTFRHRASCILGQAFHYSPENAFYIFDQQIQGDSGEICITLGNDSMSDSKQKSSYEHGSDFELLRSYGHFLFPVHALM